MLLEIFLIIFSVIALYSLHLGIHLVIFLMPLYLWRFSIFGIPSTALEAMIYILFLVWVLNKIKILDRPKTKKLKLCHSDSPAGQRGICSLSHFYKFRFLFSQLANRNDSFWTIWLRGISPFIQRFASKQFYLLNIGILLLFLGAAISTSISSDLRTSLGILKGWFFDPFLFFVVFINVIKTKDQIISSLAVWILSGIAVSLISIFYLLGGNLTFDGRLSAFFLSPNHLAMYLAPAFLIGIWFLSEIRNQKLNPLLFKEGQGWLKFWKLEIGNWEIGKYLNYKLPITNYQLQITVLAIIFISLYFTYSYGAFLGIFAGSLYLMAANKSIFKKHKTKTYLIGMILAVGLGFVFLTSGKLNNILNSNDRSSFHSRLMIWSASVEIIKDNPLFGIGPGTFQEIYLSYAGRFSKPYLEWAVPQPHNIFLAFYLQTGLIGFIGFILILFWFFQRRRHYIMSPFSGSGINNIQYPNTSIPQYSISNIITSIMIYILVHGLVDTTYWKNDLALMFWLVIGIAVAEVKMENENKNKSESNIDEK